jgi:ribosome recycling factor
MELVKKDTEERMRKSLAALADEFNTIRTGRASASLFDKIRVDYYGNPTPITRWRPSRFQKLVWSSYSPGIRRS